MLSLIKSFGDIPMDMSSCIINLPAYGIFMTCTSSLLQLTHFMGLKDES